MTVLYSHDYEDSTLKATASGVPPTISSTVARLGTKSLRCRIDLNNPLGAYRSEVTNLLLNNIDRHFAFGQTYWVGFAIYVPADYSIDTYDIVFQMQDSPAATEQGRAAPLQVFIRNGQWCFQALADTQATTVNKAYTAHISHTQLGPVQYGSWQHFVLHFAVDWTSNGFCRMWINDQQVLNYFGPLFYNDAQGPYVRLGLNRPAWKDPANWAAVGASVQGTLYFDSIKIGDSAATYAQVSPLGAAQPALGGLQAVNGNNQIAANIAVNTITGLGLSGAFAARITDGVTTETRQALGNPDGTIAIFKTGPLTSINTPAIIELDVAPNSFFNVSPLTWGDNCEDSVLLESAYATAHGPFTSGRTLVINQALNWARSVISTGISVTPGDVIDAEFYFVPGTGNQGLFGLNIGGGSYNMDYAGNLSSPLANTATTAGTGQSFDVVESESYSGLHIGRLNFVSSVSGVISLGMGPRSMTLTHSIHELGVRVWKNRATAQKTIQVNIPSKYQSIYGTPVISGITTLRQNEQTIVTVSNAQSIVKAELVNGSTVVELKDFRVNDAETGIQFTVPRNAVIGTNTLRLTRAPTAYWSNTPDTWYDTVGGTLEKTSAATTWLGDTGVNVLSAGQTWHALTEGLLTVQPEETATVELFYKLGSSERLRFGVQHDLSPEGILYTGKPRALNSTSEGFGGNHRLVEDEINGVRKLSLTFDNYDSGQIYASIGPDSLIPGQTITPLAVRAWVNRGLSTVTQTVNVLIASVPTAKRIRFAENYDGQGSDNRIKRGTVFYTGTIERVSVYQDWPLGYTGEPTTPSLASVSSVTIINGALDLLDTDFTSGSIDSLQHDSVVTVAGWNVDRSLFFIRQLKVIIGE